MSSRDRNHRNRLRGALLKRRVLQAQWLRKARAQERMRTSRARMAGQADAARTRSRMAQTKARVAGRRARERAEAARDRHRAASGR